MPLVTRIITSRDLTAGKHARLEEMARLCGDVRAETWRRYGALAGLERTNRQIRDEDWLAGPKLGEASGLPARIWKATLEDSLNAIKTQRAAAIDTVIRIVWRSGRSRDEKKRMAGMLRDGTWPRDRLLHRLMRKHWRHGVSRITNQIVLDVQGHRCFDLNGQRWIAVSSLAPRQRIAIPLGHFERPIDGAIRIRVRDDGEVDVLTTVDEKDACVSRSCGAAELGLDKGYSEVFTDSDGQRHGDGFGAMLSAESDHLKTVWAARRKLEALADKAQTAGKLSKAERIRRHNLGRQKLAQRKRRHRQKVRSLVFSACHSVFDKAGAVAVEDLRQPIRGYDRGKNMNRRLSGWAKGLIQEATEATSRRRGASVDEINAAYTSQVLPGCGAFGRRSGDALHCPSGLKTSDGRRAVFEADHIAAVNILQRKSDKGISRFLPYRQVRQVLEERSRQSPPSCLTSGQCAVPVSCLRLPRRDSSCSGPVQASSAINGERIIISRTFEYAG